LGKRKKNKKITSLIPPHPNPPQKGKNRAHRECMLNLLNGRMKLLFPKLFVINFWAGLMPGAEFWGHII